MLVSPIWMGPPDIQYVRPLANDKRAPLGAPLLCWVCARSAVVQAEPLVLLKPLQKKVPCFSIIAGALHSV